MPAARFWRIVGVMTYGGGDLSLSELYLCDAAGRADSAAAMTCSHAPVAGALGDLRDGDTATTCTFSGAFVRSPGFSINWDFGSGVTPTVVSCRFGSAAGKAQYIARCDLQYSLDGKTWNFGALMSGQFVWPGVNTLAPIDTLGDLDFENVVSLLHLDGPAGSNTVTDVIGRAWTANGVTISNAQSKFGGGSGAFDGVSSYLSTPASTDFDFGGGDFTAEAFVRFGTLSASGVIQTVFGCYSVGAAISWVFYCYNSGGSYSFNLDYSPNGVNGFPAASGPFSPSAGVWYHVAVARAAGQVRIFVDGSLVGSASLSATLASTGTGPLRVGAYYNGGLTGFFNGHIDEVRLTKGVGRYIAAFTPPAAPFGAFAEPRDAYPVLVQRSGLAAPLTSSSVGSLITSAQMGAVPVRDTEFGGRGRVRNTVKEKGTPDLPVHRRVRLVRERDGLVVREQWSNPATGAYDFQFVDELQTYTVLSYDHTLNFRAVIADGLTLANGTVELMP